MCKVVVIFFIYITAAAASSADHMEWWEYWKLCSLAIDLVVEAKNRIHQTDPIRDKMAAENGFQVGMIMGRIRDKYRAMLELYRMTNNRFLHNPNIALPAMDPIKPLYYIVRMEMIRGLEVEIDSLVRVLEALPPSDLKPSMNYLKTMNKDQLNSEKAKGQLSPDLEDPAKVDELMKQYNRDKYLRTHQRNDQIAIY